MSFQVVAPSQIRGSIPTGIVFFKSTIGPFLSLDSFSDLLTVVGNLFGNLKVVLESGEAELVQAKSHRADIHPTQQANSDTSKDIAHSYITAVVKFGAQASSPVFLVS